MGGRKTTQTRARIPKEKGERIAGDMVSPPWAGLEGNLPRDQGPSAQPPRLLTDLHWPWRGLLACPTLRCRGLGGGVEIWRGPSGPVALERRASVFSGMLQPIAGRTLDGENPARLDEGATGLRVRDLLPAVGVSRAVYCSWLVCTAD